MTSKTLELAPSVLSADFAQMGMAIDEVNTSGVNYIHLDVMDGTFVPEITFGSQMVKAIRGYSDLMFDVHLMTMHPETLIDSFVSAGANMITVHQEACIHLHRILGMIKDKGIDCGVAIVPSTPVEAIKPVLDLADLVLVMTVNPGYGGQKLIQSCLDKVALLKSLREEEGYKYLISVDGGVNLSTVQDVASAGADIAVVGSAFFKEEDKISFVERMAALVGEC